MSLYPDNAPRADRVRQLAADIAHIQAQIKTNVEDARKQDADAVEVLELIAKNAGYPTLDEYVEAAAKQMSPEDKAAFDQMKADVEKLDNDMAISHKAFRGLIAVGIFTLGIRIFAIGFKQTQSVLFGMQAVLRSIYYALAGAAESAVKLLTWGRVTLNLVSRAGGLSAEALESMKFLRIGGNVLIGIGVIVDAALLIAEAIQGAQQRNDLQNAIKELCAHRFVVKQLEQEARAFLNFKGDAKAIAMEKKFLDGLIAKGRMTEEEEKEELQPVMDDLEQKITTALNEITAQTIWKMLDDQDTESRIAWRNEDPSLDQILQYVKDHEKA